MTVGCEIIAKFATVPARTSRPTVADGQTVADDAILRAMNPPPSAATK